MEMWMHKQGPDSEPAIWAFSEGIGGYYGCETDFLTFSPDITAEL
ncbi:hypothetical protein [Paenibacillus silvestris]|nr:hypothetical protein [Paenibacillus silvestris]